MFTPSNQFRLQTLAIILIFPILLLITACGSVGAQEPADDGTIFLPITPTESAELNLTLQAEYGDINVHRVITDGIFAIWWHPDYDQFDDYDLTKEAVSLAAALNDVRRDSLIELGLKDPPNIAAGAYVNIYIHDPDSESTDEFPNWLGNGVGSNESELPYMTLPIGAHTDPLNVAHEGFHIFQYSADNPNFEYAGDSGWFIEAAADWYAFRKYPNETEAFMGSGALEAVPFITMWQSWDNSAIGDPASWQRLVRQYAMSNWLYYLTEVREVDAAILNDGYFADTGELPQEFMYRRIPNMHQLFADWAAANLADFSYISREQWERAQEEFEWVGEPDDIFPTIATLGAGGTSGDWITPPADQAPRGWSYNVVKMTLTESGPITVQFEADTTGSEGAPAFYEARVVIKNGDQFRTINMPLEDGLIGEMTIEALEGDKKIYVVLAAVPEHFGGVQTYGYRVKISRCK